ncbi:hypothetical protein H4Q26_015826 [Puccinia striiformis f. sp. tritici PST-130]|nr:hypothetical protein H4Q26_015826 [Puccinia striiformis f. sp. tritici PST-130]
MVWRCRYRHAKKKGGAWLRSTREYKWALMFPVLDGDSNAANQTTQHLNPELQKVEMNVTIFQTHSEITRLPRTELLRRCYPDVAKIGCLGFKEQLDYFRSRISLCYYAYTVKIINLIVLQQIPQPCTTMRMIPVATVGPPSVGILECNPCCKWPASVIDCKRGMVLRLLDNTGHDELEVSDRLLLIAITTSSLVVKPLTGVAAGLNVHLQRLEYVPPPGLDTNETDQGHNIRLLEVLRSKTMMNTARKMAQQLSMGTNHSK